MRKPSFSPPAWIFGPVWSVLYLGIAVSFGYIFYLFFTDRLPGAVALLFLANLFFNFIYSPVQFGLRNLLLATLDILLVLGTLILALNLVFPYAPWVSYINIPYLLWVSFATVLQISITLMNRDKWKLI